MASGFSNPGAQRRRGHELTEQPDRFSFFLLSVNRFTPRAVPAQAKVGQAAEEFGAAVAAKVEEWLMLQQRSIEVGEEWQCH
jgi:hypothetical protein